MFWRIPPVVATISANRWSELLRKVNAVTCVCNIQSRFISEQNRDSPWLPSCDASARLVCKGRPWNSKMEALGGERTRWLGIPIVSRLRKQTNPCPSTAPFATPPLQHLCPACRLVQKRKSIAGQSHISEMRPSVPASFLAQLPRMSSAYQHCYGLQIGGKGRAGCYGWLCVAIAQVDNREVRPFAAATNPVPAAICRPLPFPTPHIPSSGASFPRRGERGKRGQGGGV